MSALCYSSLVVLDIFNLWPLCYCISWFSSWWLDSKHRMQCYSFVFNEFNIIRNFHFVKMLFRCLILILTGYINCFWSCLCIWSFSSWWLGLKTQIAVFCFCMYWIQCILEFPYLQVAFQVFVFIHHWGCIEYV